MKSYKQLKEEFITYYHGSTQDFDIGDLILPPDQTNIISEKGRKKNLNKIFFTEDFKSAWIYAYRAKRSIGGIPIVYEIEPVGEINTINNTKGTTVYSSDYGIVKDIFTK